MNGPFELRDWDSSILDADGNVVAEGKAPNWDAAKGLAASHEVSVLDWLFTTAPGVLVLLVTAFL